MRSVKRYLLIFAGSLLALLLLELVFYPLSAGQLAAEADAQTAGSILVLTEEGPGELRVYRRAYLLPCYRLARTLAVQDGDTTANTDFFQVYAVSVENGELLLSRPELSLWLFAVPVDFLVFTILLYQTWGLIRKKAESPK